MSLIDRLPPSNLEAEQGVLGSCLLDNDVIDDVISAASPEDFHRNAHILMYRAIVEVYRNLGRVDAVLLAEELKRRGEFDKIGGEDYLAEVIGSVPHAANGKYYAQIVRQKAVARELIESANETLAEAYSDNFTAEDLVANAERRVFAIGDTARPDSAVAAGTAIDLVMDRLDARRNGVTGMTTGLSSLDFLTDGLHPEQLVVVAGRPGMGKTILGMNLAEHVAVEKGKPVLYACLEMNRTELGERLLSSRSRVDNYRMKHPWKLSTGDYGEIARAIGEIRAAPLVFDDGLIQSSLSIASRSRRVGKAHGAPGLIVVDYLQLVQPDDRRDTRTEQVAAMSRAFKQMARELQCPVVILAQLNRKTEDNEDKRPRMSNLRESGAIEQDADLVLLLHRAAYYDPNDSPGVVEIIVAKNRQGSTGSVKCAWLPEISRIDELTGVIDDFGPAPEQPQDIDPRPLPAPTGSAAEYEYEDEYS